MKEEKGMCSCGCNCCGGGHGHGHGMKGLFFVVGVFAFVYGLMTWAMMTYMWQPYVAWMVGGILLVLIGWLKKWLWMKKGM